MLEVVLNNDIRNHCDINGVFTCQHFEIEKAFDKLYDYLKSNKIVIDNIIEIGTFRGGFTTFLDNHKLSDNTTIHSFDVDASIGQRQISNKVKKVKFYEENVFETNTIELILKSSKKNTILFCDGGDKISEFNHFSKFLNTNDIIFAHDFAIDLSSFTKLNVWDYFECNEGAIKESLSKYNLEPLMQDTFLNVAWGSYIKK
jgi:23S rRNA U2552 (ribose-2'-O)-methylase RlmE/FtsJ